MMENPYAVLNALKQLRALGKIAGKGVSLANNSGMISREAAILMARKAGEQILSQSLVHALLEFREDGGFVPNRGIRAILEGRKTLPKPF